MKELFETIWNMPMSTLLFWAGIAGALILVPVGLSWLHMRRQFKRRRESYGRLSADFERQRERVRKKLG